MNYRIFYDAECPICCREIAHIRVRNPKGNLYPVALQNHVDLLAEYGIDADEAMIILHMIDDHSKVYTGIPAFRIIYRENGWQWLAAFMGLPIVFQVSEWLYPVIARHRYKILAWLLPKVKAKGDCQQGKYSR